MRLALCWLAPPLACLSCLKIGAACLNLILCMFGWLPGVLHAQAVVNNHFLDKRNKREIKAINNPNWVGQVLTQPRDHRLELPPIRRAKQHELPEPTYNDPSIGRHGTQFRRKGN